MREMTRSALRRLLPPDPGALRLLAALRATLAAVVTFLLVWLLGSVSAAGTADRILGFATALFIAATVRDPTPRQRLATIALAPLAAIAATALATALLDRPLAAAAVVPPLMFAIAYASTHGPRYGSLGTVALIAYFIGLLSRMPPDTLPRRLFVLLLAGAVAAVVRGVLLPERPEAELARLSRAVHANITSVLHHIVGAVAAGGWTSRQRRELRQAVFQLGEVVMLAQARISTQGDRWLQLLTLQLTTERAARVALTDLGTRADRGELLAALTALREGAEPQPGQSECQLAVTLGLLARAMHEVPQAAPIAPAASPPASTVPALRAAAQTAIAAALAVAVGDLLSPNRWYWAAFTAFVMFQGTRSRGESLAKGVQFIAGTAAGVVAGMLAATVLSGHEIVSVIIIVAAVFLAFQANLAAYGVMVFWITIILGLLFGMMGYFPPDLLLLRLQEAAVGAASGALVASLVLVRSDRDAIGDATVAFLRAIGLLVNGAVAALTEGMPPADLAAQVITAEQRVRELSSVAAVGQAGFVVSRNEVLRRRIVLLAGCEVWVRDLGRMALQATRLSDGATVRVLRELASRVETNVAAVVAHIGGQSDVSTIDAGTGGVDLVQALAAESSRHAVRLLLRINAALVHLASQ